ncbi:MAG TPA: hypothetical protein VNA20_04965 [Frankiaceae bacterium]|nr:hypothetical protein [Frankiaceae bacterium]
MSGESVVFGWLRSGVPLSLLLDLASPDGPDSQEIARTERTLRAVG